jgi:hypothetical protein
VITALVIAVVMAWFLDYAQFAITGRNYNNQFNGKGCIDSVLKGTALAPMQYRVAIPWLYDLFRHYELIKIGLMAFGLFSMWLMIHTVWGAGAYLGMFVTGIFYVVNFQFDYAEQYLELSLWAQFMTAIYVGNIYWLIICVIVGALNRETSSFLILVYVLATFNLINGLWLLLAFGAATAFVRLRYGIKKSYLEDGVMLGNELFRGKNHFHKNIKDIKRGFKWGLFPTWYAIFMAALVCASTVWGMSHGGFQYASFVGIPFIIILLFRAMVREGVRIMLPLSVFIVPMIIGVINAN